MALQCEKKQEEREGMGKFMIRNLTYIASIQTLQESFFLLMIQFFHDKVPCYRQTSPSICSANQWTSFYMIVTSVMKELILLSFTLTSSKYFFWMISKINMVMYECTRFLMVTHYRSIDIIKTGEIMFQFFGWCNCFSILSFRFWSFLFPDLQLYYFIV